MTTRIEMDARELMSIAVHRDEAETGEVTLVIATGDGTVEIAMGRTADDAEALEIHLRNAADKAAAMARDWVITPGEHDGYVTLDRHYSTYYVSLGDIKPGSQPARGYPDVRIAIYELARLMSERDEFPPAWAEGEHGPSSRAIDDEVRAFRAADGTLKPLPGQKFPDGTLVSVDGEEWQSWVITSDYGDLGVIVHTEGDPSVWVLTRPELVTLRLDWVTSGSADDENHDQEADLDAIGSPGGASWASVSPDARPGHKPWAWMVYDRWTDADPEPDPVLARGETDSEDEAKTAITAWVTSQWASENS